MCGIWDWQSTLVKDLNDSQDPQHMLFCRENAFVAIYGLFSDNKFPLFTRWGGGSPEGDNVTFFYRFFYIGAPLRSTYVASYVTIWTIITTTYENDNEKIKIIFWKSLNICFIISIFDRSCNIAFFRLTSYQRDAVIVDIICWFFLQNCLAFPLNFQQPYL